MARSVTHEDSHLTYESDKRNRPDKPRHEEFDRAWENGIDYRNGRTPSKFSENPELNKLTWSGLGFRLGAIFGEIDDNLQEELYRWCEKEWDYKEQQGLVSDDK